MEELFAEIARLRRDEIPAVLATVVDTKGSTPGKLGQRMLVYGEGGIRGSIGGGCVEADVIRAARDVLDTGRAMKMRFVLAGEEAERTGLACGGQVEIMIESLNDPHLFLIGAGHVAQKVASLAKRVDFRVTVMDDRPDFANVERFPEADAHVVGPLDRLHELLKIGPNAYILCVTRGHDFDYDALRWALTTPARYIGVLGSRSKRLQFFKQLSAEGLSDDALAAVDIPVGLAIGAEAPDEIAISIVAALIKKRRVV